MVEQTSSLSLADQGGSAAKRNGFNANNAIIVWHNSRGHLDPKCQNRQGNKMFVGVINSCLCLLIREKKGAKHDL